MILIAYSRPGIGMHAAFTRLVDVVGLGHGRTKDENGRRQVPNTSRGRNDRDDRTSTPCVGEALRDSSTETVVKSLPTVF